MKYYKPPFTLTSEIIKLSEAIAYQIGRLAGEKMLSPPIKLRRSNRIKTIQASLAIEGNTLTSEQITDILDGKRILGPPKDILEVKNALELYSNLRAFNPLNIEDLLKAHEILTKDLINDYGKFRKTSVGIFKGTQLAHLAPGANRVQSLIQELLEFTKDDKEFSWLIKSCVFHYEFEFIHPFTDGNERMGRLWQQLLLMKYHPLFEYVAVEELVKENQEDYYNTLGKSDRMGESTLFIEFMLNLTLEALNKYGKHVNIKPKDAEARLEYAKEIFKEEYPSRMKKINRRKIVDDPKPILNRREPRKIYSGAMELDDASRSLLMGIKFSRRDYMLIHQDISQATASRDLLHGIESGILEKSGSNNQTQYWFKGL